MKLSLPNPEIKPIPAERLAAMASLSEAMVKIGDGMGSITLSTTEELLNRLNAYMRKKRSFSTIVDTPNMARAFLTIYSAKEKVRKSIPFSPEIFDNLATPLSNRPGPLIRLYFEHYNQLLAYNEMRAYLLTYFRERGNKTRLTKKNRSYLENASMLFGNNGPREIAKEATKRSRSLRELEKFLHLPTKGVFHDLAYRWYYVSHAQTIPTGELTPILRETIQPEINCLPMEDRTLKHHLISTLVNRCIAGGHMIPKDWLKYILKIAGDPRIPTASPRYQKNWAGHSDTVIKKVKASLAKRDLGFFLNLLGKFAEEEGGDIARMYPSRRRFLEGFLSAEDGIQDALLILSPQGKNYIKRQLPAEERRDFECSTLSGNTTQGMSAIYLELPNGHLIEGSHQSMLRLYSSEAELPIRLRDRRPKTVPYQEITQSAVSFDQRHHPDLRWQHNVLSHLSQYDYGVTIDPEEALSEEDYRQMIRKYGIPR